MSTESSSITVSERALALAPDLTRRAPRSPRCRLGGYALAPRMLDKARADLAGKTGEYHFNCPLDRHFFEFTGIDAQALQAHLAEGRTDGEMLEWINSHAVIRHTPWEIEAWSDYQERRLPDSDRDTASYFSAMLSELTVKRPDIHTWMDLLDLDDHVSFGGSA